MPEKINLDLELEDVRRVNNSDNKDKARRATIDPERDCTAPLCSCPCKPAVSRRTQA